MLTVSLLATLGVASAADELKLYSWSFTEDWEDYKVKDYTTIGGHKIELENGAPGDWVTHYEYAGRDGDQIKIVDGETWSPDGLNIKPAKGSGKVLYINNYDSNGTYVNLGYVGTDEGKEFYARNFTVEYDFMPVHSDKSGGWLGFISRWTSQAGGTNVHYSNSVNVITTASMTPGTAGDRIPTDNGTRPGEASDTGYHTRSGTASGTGANDMTYESGIDKVSDRLWKHNGGSARFTWYSIRIEAKDSYYTVYMREKCTDTCEADCDKHGWFDTGTRYYTDISNAIYSGTVGFGQCASAYLYDNFKFTSNDGASVTVTNTTTNAQGKAVGKAKLMSSTAKDGSIIELISETDPGYTFDVWYKDAELDRPVTPVEFVLQEHVLNTNYGLYDWEEVIGATKGIGTWEELQNATVYVKDGKVVEQGTAGAEEMAWLDFYATSADTKYRLITRVKAGESYDGYNFYATSALKKFNVTIYSNDEDMGTVSSANFVDGVGKFVLDQQGTLVAEPLPGYKFAGWYKEVRGTNIDADGNVKEGTYVVKVSDQPSYDFTLDAPENVTFKASFVPESASVANMSFTLKMLDESAVGANYGGVTTTSGSYMTGDKISLIAYENPGYAFVRWEDGNGVLSTDKYYDYVVKEGDNVITAVFEIETYRIFITDGIGGSEVVRTAKANSRITMYPATAPDGYYFAGWLVGGLTSDDYTYDNETHKLELNVTSRVIRVQARFVKQTHRVRFTYNITGAGTALGGGTKAVGDKVTIRPQAKDGYTVSRFVIRGVDATLNQDGSMTFTMPNEDVVVRIEFVTIDSIDVGSEVTMYAVFALVGLGIVASLLFANTKDKRDKR